MDILTSIRQQTRPKYEEYDILELFPELQYLSISSLQYLSDSIFMAANEHILSDEFIKAKTRITKDQIATHILSIVDIAKAAKTIEIFCQFIDSLRAKHREEIKVVTDERTDLTVIDPLYIGMFYISSPQSNGKWKVSSIDGDIYIHSLIPWHLRYLEKKKQTTRIEWTIPKDAIMFFKKLEEMFYNPKAIRKALNIGLTDERIKEKCKKIVHDSWIRADSNKRFEGTLASTPLHVTLKIDCFYETRNYFQLRFTTISFEKA